MTAGMNSARLLFPCALAALACACGPTWPVVQPSMTRAFARGDTPVVDLDVLPLDVTIATYEGNKVPAETIANGFYQVATQTIVAGLHKRGYSVRSLLDWSGASRDAVGQPMGMLTPPAHLYSAVGWLKDYGHKQSLAKGHNAPPLPVVLGITTGSDATLYVGGYAFSGYDEEGIDADDVAKGILIAAAAIVVVVAVAAIFKDAPKGSLGSAAGHAAGAVVKGAASVGRVAVHGAGMVARGAGHVAEAMLDGMAHGTIQVEWHSTVYPTAPPPPAPYPEVERATAQTPSQILLDMTLVDNRTRRPLWHARQKFPANPALADDVAEAIRSMLETLPAR